MVWWTNEQQKVLNRPIGKRSVLKNVSAVNTWIDYPIVNHFSTISFFTVVTVTLNMLAIQCYILITGKDYELLHNKSSLTWPKIVAHCGFGLEQNILTMKVEVSHLGRISVFQLGSSI